MLEVAVSCLPGSLSHRDSEEPLENFREITSHQQVKNTGDPGLCAFNPLLLGVLRELLWHYHTLPESLRYQHQPESVVE